MSDDFTWFKEHYNDFQKKFGNAFIVIKNKSILGVYKTYAEGVKKTLETEELGTFIVQECASDYEAYNCCISSMNFM